ncbi:MAG: hypothetical protein LIO59_01470 [Oscillospiraceae bacterium]|nr:hypothetical protein [Oscillospiraceae bacterium]
MDTAITRAEHEEFRRMVDANFDALTVEDKRLNERLKVVEETNRQISDMNITLQKQRDILQSCRKTYRQLQRHRTRKTSA